MKTTFSIKTPQEMRRSTKLRGTAALPREYQNRVAHVDLFTQPECVPELYLFQKTGTVTFNN